MVQIYWLSPNMQIGIFGTHSHPHQYAHNIHVVNVWHKALLKHIARFILLFLSVMFTCCDSRQRVGLRTNATHLKFFIAPTQCKLPCFLLRYPMNATEGFS